MESGSNKLERPDIALEKAGKIVLVIIWCLTIYIYPKLPEVIPTHFDALGQVDANGNKLNILFLLFGVTISYVLLTNLSGNIAVIRFLQKLALQSKEKPAVVMARMIRVLKLELLLIFSLMVLFIYLISIGALQQIEIWLLPLAFGVLLLPSIITITQTARVKTEVYF